MSSKAVEAILLHMNKDHKVSLYDYLANYSGIKLDIDNPHQSVELVDVRLDKLTLNYNETGTLKSAVIPIDPPMKDLGHARTRLISMAFRSADKLQKSPYRITEFVKPAKPLEKFGVVATIFSILLLAAVHHHPQLSAYVSNAFSPRLPKLAQYMVILTLGIHTGEFLFVVSPLLRFFRAPTRVFLRYFVSVLACGLPVITPLKRKAAALRAHRSEFEKNR